MATVEQHLQKAMTQVDLLPGEQQVYATMADGFFIGTNPAAKAIALFNAFMTKITGGHIRVFLILTTHRVILVQSTAQWCGCFAGKVVHSIALRSVQEIGSAKETQFCFVHTRLISLQSLTQTFNLVVKGMNDADIKQYVSAVSAQVVQNAERGQVV